MMENKTPYLKRKKTGEDNYIDLNTGEIAETYEKHDTLLVGSKDQFFITYARVVGLYKDLSGTQIKVLSYLVLHLTSYNSNIVTLTNEIKQEIADKMNISYSAVNNSIKPLVSKEILIKKGNKPRSATYIINPMYYWKGDLKERDRNLKFVLELKYEGDIIEEPEAMYLTHKLQ